MPSSVSAGFKRRTLFLAAAATTVVLGAQAAFAQSSAQAFPSKPVTLIVPWPAGGSTDRHLRGLSEIASKHLGQQIVIQNQPGGGGTTGPGNMALQAKPDGYTIAQYPLGMTRIPHMQKTLWHPINDFSFIIGVTGYTFGLVVKSDSPYQTMQDFIEAARKAPGQVDYGSTGTGSSPHLLMEELAIATKVQFNHIPFKGNADSMQALLGGHTKAASDASGWDKFVDGGQMRLLVTFGDKRTKRWPNVPTAKELGYGIVSSSPYGLVGPKGMDPAVVKALHDAYKKAIEDPKHLELLDQLNQDVWYKSSADYRAWAVETFAKEKALIERLGLAAK